MRPASALEASACAAFKAGGVGTGSAGYDDEDMAESQLTPRDMEYKPVDEPEMERASRDEAAWGQQLAGSVKMLPC